MNEVIIPLVRHVPTKLNAQGISRSWLRVPPDPEKLEELGPGIAETLKKLNVNELRSSDLPRAARTADWLGEKLGVPVEKTYNLRTWDTGNRVAGKKESETIPIRKQYIRNSEIAPAGGESFENAIERNKPEFKEAQRYNAKHADAPRALVVHGHHMMFAEQIFSGKPKNANELDSLDDDFPPGSVMLLHVRPDGAELERIHPKGFKETADK